MTRCVEYNNGSVGNNCGAEVRHTVTQGQPSTTITMLDSDSFDLLTAIRYDSSLLLYPWNSAVNHGQPSPFCLLPYHFSRLNAAAALHGWRHPFTPPSWSSFQHACQRAVESYNGLGKGGPLKVSFRFYFPVSPIDSIHLSSFDLFSTVPVLLPSPQCP